MHRKMRRQNRLLLATMRRHYSIESSKPNKSCYVRSKSLKKWLMQSKTRKGKFVTCISKILIKPKLVNQRRNTCKRNIDKRKSSVRSKRLRKKLSSLKHACTSSDARPRPTKKGLTKSKKISTKLSRNAIT